MSRRDFKNKKNIVFGHIYHEKQHLGYCAKVTIYINTFMFIK